LLIVVFAWNLTFCLCARQLKAKKKFRRIKTLPVIIKVYIRDRAEMSLLAASPAGQRGQLAV